MAGATDVCPLCGHSNLVPGDSKASREVTEAARSRRHHRRLRIFLRIASKYHITVLALLSLFVGIASGVLVWQATRGLGLSNASSAAIVAAPLLLSVICVASVLRYKAAQENGRVARRSLRARNLDKEDTLFQERKRTFEEETRNREQRLTIWEAEINGKAQRVEAVVAQKAAEATTAERERLAYEQGLLADAHRIYAEKASGFPWLARAQAELGLLQQHKLADWMESKSNPAPTAAHRIREIAGLKREAEERWRVSKGVIDYWLTLFPFLEDFLGDVDEDVLKRILDNKIRLPARDESELGLDPVRAILSNLSDAEWNSLTPAERNDLALQRYVARHKSRWEIGRQYERYIGYLLEKAEYKVLYQGILDGYEDLGRDLVARSQSETLVVQCKCWSASKVIHEKHVTQLFGTMTKYELDHPEEVVCGVLYTTTELSSTATEFAVHLGIKVHSLFPLREYPMVKCNLARRTGDRIYHLPFDQQYDRVIIEPHRSEFYAWTAEEAEAHGYRRAWRWSGDAATF